MRVLLPLHLPLQVACQTHWSDWHLSSPHIAEGLGRSVCSTACTQEGTQLLIRETGGSVAGAAEGRTHSCARCKANVSLSTAALGGAFVPRGFHLWLGQCCL